MDSGCQCDHSFFDISSASFHMINHVVNKMLLWKFWEDISPESSWLLKVNISCLLNIVLCNCTLNFKWFDRIFFIFNWAIQSVWLIVRQASLVAIHNWSAVSLIILDTIYRAIDWNLIKVSTKSVPVSIWVWKNSSLEYSVICKLNSWH